jgi:hypothetical protein
MNHTVNDFHVIPCTPRRRVQFPSRLQRPSCLGKTSCPVCAPAYRRRVFGSLFWELWNDAVSRNKLRPRRRSSGENHERPPRCHPKGEGRRYGKHFGKFRDARVIPELSGYG